MAIPRHILGHAMRLTIFTKLLLAIFLGMLVILGAMLGSVQWSFQRGFDDYLRKVEARRMDALAGLLEAGYARHGAWDFLRDNPYAWFDLLGQVAAADKVRDGPEPPPAPPFEAAGGFPGPPPGHPHHFGHAGPPYPPLFKHGHLRVVDLDKVQVVGPPEGREPGAMETLRPLLHAGRTVGWLGFLPDRHATDRLQAAFVEQYARANTLIAVVALAVSFLLSLALARQFLAPIRRLAAGANALVAGDYATRIPVGSRDELGRLAGDFNRLAQTLERNEQARRQWVADTSHELRTPLAVLRSEVEALIDGVREPSPDRLRSLHCEILALGKLVDDLRELSSHDLGSLDYRMAGLDLAGLALDCAEGFRSRFEAKGIGLKLPEPIPLPILGDAGRLRQLFLNLLENSLRYTDAGGVCRIALGREGNTAWAALEDSAPGVPETALPRLFERFFRLDPSRSRALGGTGLGLAICRGIAEAHGGGLSAAASPLGGLRLRLDLPLAPP